MCGNSRALKTMEKLVQKIEFDGPSLTITSRNLAVGISAINSSSFSGANFSAFFHQNSSDPQVLCFLSGGRAVFFFSCNVACWTCAHVPVLMSLMPRACEPECERCIHS